MELYPLKSKPISPRDSIGEKLTEALRENKLSLRDKDIVAVASKVVALTENRLKDLAKVKASERAVELGRKYSMPSNFVQVVLDESEVVYGGVKGALLTLKKGDAVANAGVDLKNVPEGFAVAWPASPDLSAERLRNWVAKVTGKKIGVVIVDSRVTPLRLGTIGLAIGSAGFEKVKDFRGIPDLYGREARITYQAISDGIAGAAQLLMGEGKESVPFVLVRGAPASFDGRRSIVARISSRECLYMSQVGPGQLSKKS